MLKEQISNKKSRGEMDLPANGDNSDQLLKDYVSKVFNIEEEITALRGDIKEILSNAKNDGFLKTSIKDTVKNLRKTEEQRQSKREVDETTAHYTALCKDLPLFHAAA